MLTTIRAFALERLAAHGETAAAYAALIAWCMVLADPGQAVFYESLPAAALDRLEAELANLRAAFTWLDETGDAATALQLAVALGSFWHVRGQIGEGRDRIERALAACPTAPAELRARALYWMGQLAVHGANDPRGIRLAGGEPRPPHAKSDDRAGALATTILLGGAAEYRGNDEQAMDYYGRALAHEPGTRRCPASPSGV